MKTKMGMMIGPPQVVAMIVMVAASLFSSVAAANSDSFQKQNVSFDGFTDQSRSSLRFEGSDISLGALQLTPETRNEVFAHNRSGRVMFADPFRLWLSDDDILASFNSTFVINIYRESTWVAGHGLAFLIAPNLTMPAASHGQWLGLTNASTDGNPANQIVAVEFDTLMQSDIGDPDGNHVGLNINSVRSKIAVPLNFTLSPPPPPGANYTVWIDYNGSAKVMEVYMADGNGPPKPAEALIRDTINLKDLVKQDSYIGFAGSTGNPEIELNCVLKWELIIDRLPRKKDTKWVKIGFGAGVPAAAVLIILAVVGGVYCVRRRRARKAREEPPDEFWRLRWLPGMPREFKYKELKKATNNFDEAMKLGEGGFGVVYKGVLFLHQHQEDQENNTAMEEEGRHIMNPDNTGSRNSSTTTSATRRTEIAVKKFSRDSIKGKDDFLAELTIIHRLRHKNLVHLVGWCYEKGKLLLVYDFMPNGSLEKHLYVTSDQDTVLSWSRRFNILAGVSSALHYLHNEYDQKVVHRDIKASNILLDVSFNARLGDFGLARALENERNSYAELGLGGVPGTMGYVAPECFHTGRATPESDVFGFGAVVLEVVCGRGPGIKIHQDQHLYSLIDWVWMLHREGRIEEAVDERLSNDFVEDEARRLLLLGLACSHPIDSERPKTQEILQIISGTISPPLVPPFKPVFSWPAVNADSLLSSMSLSTTGSIRTQSLSKLHNSSSDLPV